MLQQQGVQRYRERHRDRVRERSRQAYVRNLEKERARHRADRLADPEKHRLKVRRSYQRHAEQRREARRDYRARNLEKEKAAGRQYRREHPEKVREWAARRRALKKATQREPIDYNRIIERDGYVCHICGGLVAPDELQFDHIIPLSRGGTHTYDNIAVAHATCNHQKCARIVVSASPPRMKRRR